MSKEKIVAVMKRYELKYYLSEDQLSYFLKRINQYMKVDRYGLTTIATLYFDTPDFRLINKSIEKPKYKEKLRLRSYGLAKKSSPTFLEIKRKSDGIVYKRRASLLEDEAYELIRTKEGRDKDDEVDIRHILERFYRSPSNKKEGSGVGLSVAQEIVKLHKGKISVDKNSNTISFVITFNN